MSKKVQELLEAIERDNLVAIKRILKDGNLDLNIDVVIGQEYDIDEPDEIPLLFYVIQKNISIEALRELIKNGLKIDYLNREGLGAIDIAIKYRRMDIVKLCKEYGISLTKSSRKSGMTPLMLASAFNDIDMIDFLIKEGADINHIDNFGMSALDYAKKLGQTKVLKHLEDLGAKYNLYK